MRSTGQILAPMGIRQQLHLPTRTAQPLTSPPCPRKTRAPSLLEAVAATAGIEPASFSPTMPLPLTAPSEKPLVLPHCPPKTGVSQAPQASCPTSTPTPRPGYPPSGRIPSPGLLSPPETSRDPRSPPVPSPQVSNWEWLGGGVPKTPGFKSTPNPSLPWSRHLCPDSPVSIAWKSHRTPCRAAEPCRQTQALQKPHTLLLDLESH